MNLTKDVNEMLYEIQDKLDTDFKNLIETVKPLKSSVNLVDDVSYHQNTIKEKSIQLRDNIRTIYESLKND